MRLIKIGLTMMLVASLFISAGCSSNNKETTNQNNNNTKTTDNGNSTNDTPDGNESLTLPNELTELLNNPDSLGEAIAYLMEHLSELSAVQLEAAVGALNQAQKSYLTELEKKYTDGTVQEKWANAYPGDVSAIDPSTLDADLKTLFEETIGRGYKVEMQEGSYYPVLDYSVYGPIKSAAGKSVVSDFIDIMMIESSEPTAKDGAILIGWNELLQRADKSNKFITVYQQSPLIEEIKPLFERYLYLTLNGADNTPLFKDKQMVNDAKEAYTEYTKVDASGEIPFHGTIHGFMNVLEGNGFKLDAAVEQFVKEQSTLD